jgi:hypothetical protein
MWILRDTEPWETICAQKYQIHTQYYFASLLSCRIYSLRIKVRIGRQSRAHENFECAPPHCDQSAEPEGPHKDHFIFAFLQFAAGFSRYTHCGWDQIFIHRVGCSFMLASKRLLIHSTVSTYTAEAGHLKMSDGHSIAKLFVPELS